MMNIVTKLQYCAVRTAAPVGRTPLVIARWRYCAIRAATRTPRAPSAVAKPKWREMLHAVKKLQRPAPIKYVACLNEIMNAALKEREGRSLLEDKDFCELLERVAARSYGFSSQDTYVLVASLIKLPGSPASGKVLSRCLEQLRDEAAALDDVQFGHLSLLLARFIGGRGDGGAVREAAHAFWPDYAELLAKRAPRLRGKGLCMVAAGLSQAQHRCSEGLLEGLAQAATIALDDLPATQLPGLIYSLASLALRDSVFFVDAASRLGLLADQFAPKQTSISLLALATVGISPATTSAFTALSHRSLEVARWCGPGEALHMLRAFCAASLFSVKLLPGLLLQVSKVPRSSLSEADDNGLHQVSLSLLNEPMAADVLAAVQSMPELWDHCYQPEESIGDSASLPNREVDASDNASANPVTILTQIASERGWTCTHDASLMEDFYRVALLLESPGHRAVVDFDITAQPWLSSPTDVWRRLKHRHLELAGFKVIWVHQRVWEHLGLQDARREGERLICGF